MANDQLKSVVFVDADARPDVSLSVRTRIHVAVGVKCELPLDDAGKLKTAFEALRRSSELCEHWSSRSAEIEELVAGDEGGLGLPASAAGKRQAALETRGEKPVTPTARQLHAKWASEAAAFGFDAEAVQQLCYQATRVDPDAAYKEARDATLTELTASESDFSEREFMQKVFERLQHHGLSIDEVTERITADLAQSQDIVRLNVRHNELTYTTKEMWELEERR